MFYAFFWLFDLLPIAFYFEGAENPEENIEIGKDNISITVEFLLYVFVFIEFLS